MLSCFWSTWWQNMINSAHLLLILVILWKLFIYFFYFMCPLEGNSCLSALEVQTHDCCLAQSPLTFHVRLSLRNCHNGKQGWVIVSIFTSSDDGYSRLRINDHQGGRLSSRGWWELCHSMPVKCQCLWLRLSVKENRLVFGDIMGFTKLSLSKSDHSAATWQQPGAVISG